MTTIDRARLARLLRTNYPFIATVDADDGWYYIEFPDLPGCMSGAATLEELPAMMREALEGWMEGTMRAGVSIPEPTTVGDDDTAAYSGKFNVRLPKSLHRQLANRALREGVSLNQHVLTLLAAGSAALAPPAAKRSRAATASPRVAERRAPYRVTRTRRPTPRKPAARRTPAKPESRAR